jgi:glycosyltransferase involved in cell wall biosynthesis
MEKIIISQMVSVGIPTYNRADLLRRALEIITTQTYTHLEIIVSDNASSDERVKNIVDEFRSKDARIIYFKQDKNLGVLANAEFVLRKSQGEYFTWFSDDDWRSPEFIELLVEELKEHPEVNFAFCDYREVYSDGSRADGYPPSHLKVFEPFQSKSRLIRTLSYYWQNAKLGKPNLFYSLFRRAALSGLDIRKISGDFHHLNMDCLIGFSMLQKSPVRIRREAMCTLTCGNKKYYLEDGNSKKKNITLFSKLANFISEHKRDRDLYIQHTDSLNEKLLIYSLFFPKIIVLIANIILQRLIQLSMNFKSEINTKKP